MKRLLAYLFLVLGLGLVVNTFSFADVKNLPTICKPRDDNYVFLRNESYVLNFDQVIEFKDKLIKNSRLILEENFINHEKQIKLKNLKCPKGTYAIKPYKKKDYDSNKLKVSSSYIKYIHSPTFDGVLKSKDYSRLYLYALTKFSKLNNGFNNNNVYSCFQKGSSAYHDYREQFDCMARLLENGAWQWSSDINMDNLTLCETRDGWSTYLTNGKCLSYEISSIPTPSTRNYKVVKYNLNKKTQIAKKEPTQTQQAAKKENKKEDKPLTEKDLENMQPSKSRLEAIVEFFKESSENKIPIDPDAAALKFGYKSFEEFVKDYFRVMEITNLSVNDVREFLADTDETVIIDQSQENLDKLYSIIMNTKYFKKQNTYFKQWEKGITKKGKPISEMALAVYLNYEKEMAKITKNPNLKEISPFTWWWGQTWGTGYTPYKYALEGCEKDAKKYKLFGGECIIVDWRSKITGKIKNMIKPSVRVAARNEKLGKQKLKPKKEKKKEIAKVTVQTEKPKSTIDLIIPVQVYIIQVNEKGYKTTTTPEDVRNDFKVVNSLWNAQGIQFELIDIVKSKGNAKSLKKDLKWVKEKYLKSLKINPEKGTIKSDESKKEKYWRMLHKLIKGTTNRNKNAINLFYVPYLPGQFMCGVAYSYSTIIDSSLDPYKRKNAGYAIIGEQSICESGATVAHEIGHMFSLGHKEITNVDLMMWGNGERIISWQADKIRKYHNKYLKRTLALN